MLRDLKGRRVLVVEDDYYQATDIVQALRGAGAEVLGPCPSEDAARAEMDRQRPDAALLDINLGTGPTFKLAGLLKERGVPIVFLTGYDQAVIPAEFDRFERVEKPADLRNILVVIAKVVTSAD